MEIRWDFILLYNTFGVCNTINLTQKPLHSENKITPIMTKKYFIIILFFSILIYKSHAQPWQRNDEMFSLKGIPALMFSSPRFADLDSDGFEDLIAGGSDEGLIFLKNVGNLSTPNFVLVNNIFDHISELDAVVADFADFDDDGDLDMITGGFNGLIYFENTGTKTQPNYEKREEVLDNLEVGADPVPALADLNNDGKMDLLAGLAENGAIKYYYNQGTRRQPLFKEEDAIYPGIDVGLFAYPYLSDFDRDMDIDLFIGHDESELYYYKNVGDMFEPDFKLDTEKFADIPPEHFFVSPCLVDLDHDAYLELVYGHYEGQILYFINEGFNIDPDWVQNDIIFGGTITSGSKSDPCLYDMDNDNDLDLISGNGMGEVLYFENIGRPDSAIWKLDSIQFDGLDISAYASVAIGDLRSNGKPDMIVSGLSGELFYFENQEGTFVLTDSIITGVDIGKMGCPYLVNMDGDRDLDLLVGNETGKVLFFENQGSRNAPHFVLRNDDFLKGVETTHDANVAAADFDDDGDVDIFVSMGAGVGILRYFENTGTVENPVWTEDTQAVDNIKVGQSATPALGDLDNDGDLDLVIGESSGNFTYFENLRIQPTPPENSSENNPNGGEDDE